MFNPLEFHFSEVTSFKIGTLVIDIIQFFLLEEKTHLCKTLVIEQIFYIHSDSFLETVWNKRRLLFQEQFLVIMIIF